MKLLSIQYLMSFAHPWYLFPKSYSCVISIAVEANAMYTIIAPRGSIYRKKKTKNRSGPGTEPCGAPMDRQVAMGSFFFRLNFYCTSPQTSEFHFRFYIDVVTDLRECRNETLQIPRKLHTSSYKLQSNFFFFSH